MLLVLYQGCCFYSLPLSVVMACFLLPSWDFFSCFCFFFFSKHLPCIFFFLGHSFSLYILGPNSRPFSHHILMHWCPWPFLPFSSFPQQKHLVRQGMCVVLSCLPCHFTVTRDHLGRLFNQPISALPFTLCLFLVFFLVTLMANLNIAAIWGLIGHLPRWYNSSLALDISSMFPESFLIYLFFFTTSYSS